MHKCRTVGAKFALGAVQSQHRLALPLRDRLTHLTAIDIIPGRIDCARASLRLFPVALKGASALILRLVDLMMGMQPSERVVTKRA